MIRVNVSLANASVTETETLTAGRVGLECGFTFSSEWDDLLKVAVFEGEQTIEVALGTASVAVVPPECMATAGYNLRIGVYGLSPANAIVIPTVWAKAGKIKDSAGPDEDSFAPATPELVAQIMSASETALSIAQGVAADAEAGEFDGVSPTVAVTETTGGHTVTITDRDGNHNFDVMDGASAYAQAVEGGYTESEQQFNTDLARFKTYAAEAESSANAAAASENNAGDSATAAASSATAALNAKTAAEQARTAAAQSASNAATAASTASTKAGEAAQSATSAASSAATAAQKASEASASATAAAGSATSAGSAASAAAASATAAGNAQTAAETAQGKAEDAQEAAETAQDAAEAAAASIAESAAQIAQNTEDVADLKSALEMESGGPWAGAAPSFSNYSYASVGTLNGYKLTLSQGDVVSGSSARIGCAVLYNSEDFVGKKLILKPHFTISGDSSAFALKVTKQTSNDGVYTTIVSSLTDPEIELDFTNATYNGLRYNYMYFFLTGRGVTLAENTVVEYIGYEIYDTTGSTHSERLDQIESNIEQLDNWVTNGLTVNLIQSIESNTYYRYSDGEKLSGGNYLSSTGLIPVTEGKTYTMNTLAGTQPHWTCWNAAKTYVTGSQSSGYSYTISTGQNIKFLRASFLMANEATVMIVEGADVDYNNYYPYGHPAKYAKSQWYGKKAAMFGDSLTKMGYWEQMFGDILGLSTYEILGQSGGNMTAIANYVQNIPADTDLLTVWAGTNDFANEITLGEFGSTNVNEYAGALQYVIQYCGEHYPLMKILLITPMQRFDSVVSSWSKDANGAYINPNTNKTLEDYANMVKTYGANYAIPVLDMYHASGFNQYNASAYSADLLHPSRPGFQRLCWRIIEAAKAI